MAFLSDALKQELIKWSVISSQTSLRGWLELLPWFAALAFVGQGLGSKALAALSLAEAWGYCFVIAAWTGMMTTTSAFVSQSHGAGQHKTSRGWLFLSLLIVFIMDCLTAVAWYLTEPVLLGVGFDAELVKSGASFLVAAIPSLFFSGIAIPISAYLTSVHIAWLPALLEFTSCAVSIGATYVFVLGYGNISGKGLPGAAMGWNVGSAFSATQYSIALLCVWGREPHCPKHEQEREEPCNDFQVSVPLLQDIPAVDPLSEHRAWEAADTEISEHSDAACGPAESELHYAVRFALSPASWRACLSQAVPNCATAALDACQFTLISFLAAKMGAEDIAAHNSMLCLFELSNTVSQGMSQATLVRVGYHLGRRDPAAARAAAAVGVASGAVWGVAAAAVGLSLTDRISAVFTNDPLVLADAAQVAPLLWGCYALLAVGMQLLAVLDGSCRGRDQAWVFLIGIWFVGVPAAAASAAWTTLGLRGLWGGLLLGFAVVVVLGGMRVARSDWERLATAAEWLATVGAAQHGGAAGGAAGPADGEEGVAAGE